MNKSRNIRGGSQASHAKGQSAKLHLARAPFPVLLLLLLRACSAALAAAISALSSSTASCTCLTPFYSLKRQSSTACSSCAPREAEAVAWHATSNAAQLTCKSGAFSRTEGDWLRPGGRARVVELEERADSEGEEGPASMSALARAKTSS